MLEGILGAITVGVWLALIPMLFYHFFILGYGSDEEKIKKIMYGWGIQVYFFGVMVFTLANMFFSMTGSDFALFSDYVLTNLPQILGGTLWILTLVFFGYFFKIRRPSRRERAEKEVRGTGS